MLHEIAGFLDAAPDAIIITDDGGKIIVVNIQTEKMFGYERTELIGWPIEMLIPERFREQHQKHRQVYSLNPVCRPMSGMGLWGLRKDGSEFPVEIGLGSVTNKEGLFLSSIIRDITFQEDAKEQLRLQLRTKEEFLAILAHEVRNPLSVISNAVQVLGHIGSQDTQVVCVRRMMMGHIRHLGRMVDDLMDVSRFNRGHITLQSTVFEIKEAILQGIDAARFFMDEKRHRLMIDLACESINVHADLVRITQVVSNLLHNAAKYTQENGEIILKMARDSDNPDFVLITIQDNGVGINPQILDKIWDIFVQDVQTLNRSQGGLGIGLTLVRNIVMMHKGRVEAFSEGCGRGSKFTVRLPIFNIQLMPSPEIAASHTCHCILIVDDIVDAADILGMLLKLEGHEVYTARNSQTALQLFSEVRPDIVLLDIGMPEMDGYEIARRIRQMDGNVLLIAVTGFGSDDDRLMSQEAGFNCHLVKPIEPKDLAEYLT